MMPEAAAFWKNRDSDRSESRVTTPRAAKKENA